MLREEDLINGLLNRDIEVLEIVMDKYSNLLYTIVNQVCSRGSKEDIEEVVSDVFVSTWRDIKNYDSARGSFKTWLCMKAKYKALDKNRALNRIVLQSEFTEVDSGYNIEEIVIGLEEKEKLLQTIEKESKINKEIFYQRYFYNQSVKELAHEYNVTEAAISNRLYRINNKIKNELSSYFEGE